MTEPNTPDCGERAYPVMSWWGLALAGQFLLVFAIVAISAPGRIDIVDGQARYEAARSLVDHGDSIIRDNEVWFAVYQGRDWWRYTDYRIPQTALGVVAIVAADATGPLSETRRQFFFTLTSPFACSVLAVTYALWFRGLGHSPAASLLWATAGIFCTPNWYYGTSSFDDILGTSAIVLAVAVAWLSRERWPLLGAAIAGLAMGWAVNCKPPLGLFALPVLAAGYLPGKPLRRQMAQAGLVFFGIMLGVIFFKAYDLYKFPPGWPSPVEQDEERYGKMWTSNPIPGLASLALSPSSGVFWYCPPLLLACLGWLWWRREQPLFCWAVVIASSLFTLFLCFITFFKGEPSWGPRYSTPVFALWWVFVPAAIERVRRSLAVAVLAAGVVVQVLGLSIDPQRLFFQTPLSFNYYVDFPWLGFNPQAAHLPQRVREITEVLTYQGEPPREFSPAPLPTHAGGVRSVPIVFITSLVGMSDPSTGAGPLVTLCSIRPGLVAQTTAVYRETVHRYHIFSSLRPWCISQRHLPPEQRPVDLRKTLALLVGTGIAGLGMMLVGSRQTRVRAYGRKASRRTSPDANDSPQHPLALATSRVVL